MDIKSVICVSFLLLIFLPLRPSEGRSGINEPSEEVYEIDYRGPETHSYIPPPERSGRSPYIHHKSVMTGRKFTGPKASVQKLGKRVHD